MFKQPNPTEGEEDVTEALIALIRERQQYGIRKYGTTLHTFDGRRNLEDALDEVLDLAQYLQKEIMERRKLEDKVGDLQEVLRLVEWRGNLTSVGETGICPACGVVQNTNNKHSPDCLIGKAFSVKVRKDDEVTLEN